LGGIFSI